MTSHAAIAVTAAACEVCGTTPCRTPHVITVPESCPFIDAATIASINAVHEPDPEPPTPDPTRGRRRRENRPAIHETRPSATEERCC